MCYDLKKDVKKKERALPKINKDTDLSQFFTITCKHPDRENFTEKMKMDPVTKARYYMVR